MSIQTLSEGAITLIFDDTLWPAHKALPKSFEFERRLRKGAQPLGTGRGSALLWTRKDGQQWVLRHYRRGGWAGWVTPDRYLWLGLARTRAYREFHLLAALHAEGLPVPRPVAARIVHNGPSYRQDLITERLPGTVPLCNVLGERALSGDDWLRLGACLARFRDAQVGHADLNAANILVDASGTFSLIDFDRALRPASPAFQAASLRRLRRSLDKWAGKRQPFHFTEADWTALLAGYGEPSSR